MDALREEPQDQQSASKDLLSSRFSYGAALDMLQCLLDAVKDQAKATGQESIRLRQQRIKAEKYLKDAGR